MSPRVPLLERAFELARSGEVSDIVGIKIRLHSEGYTGIDAHLDGPKIRADLRQTMGSKKPGRPKRESPA